MWRGMCIRILILIFVIIFFSLLYYLICYNEDNWRNRNEDLGYFDALFFTLNTITTVGNSPYSEQTVKCQVVSIFLYIVMLIGVIELINSFVGGEKTKVM